MPVGSGKKRRLRREKAAAKAAELAAATGERRAATGAAEGSDSASSGFVRVKRARTSEAGPTPLTEEPPHSDATENWITGGVEGAEQRAQRAERKRKAREEKAESGEAPASAGERGSRPTKAGTRIDILNPLEVFVGGIPFTATEDEVRGFFAAHACGGITDVRIPKKDGDLAKGFCHVSFGAPEEAQAAIKCSGKYLGDRYLQIKLAGTAGKGVNSRRDTAVRTVQPIGCKTLFARNLAYSADEDALKNHVKKLAGTTPIEIRIPIDFHTQRSKGYAYIQLADEEDAAKAMKSLEATQLLGRPMFLDYEDRKQFVANYKPPS